MDKNYNIPFSVGIINRDIEEVHLSRGAKSLPWLILTDRRHIVRANGFALSELDERIKAIIEK